MSLRLLLDRNMSPDWVPVLCERGWRALHWSTVDDVMAGDGEIMDWAAANRCVVLTDDLDFGTMLALSPGGAVVTSPATTGGEATP